MRPQTRQLSILLCFMFLMLQLDAQRISIQGTLKDINGKAIPDGTPSVIFKLYSAITGGSAIWTETANVTVTGGVYSYYLGSVNPLDAGDFSGPRYLGVTITGSELSPRTELSYAPYAMSVASAQSIANNTGTAIFDADGDLTINKGFNMENAKQFFAKNSSGTLETFLSPRWSDNVTYLNMGSAGFNLRNNAGTSRMFIEDNGETGIGTTTPANRLDVEGGLAVGASYSGASTAPTNGAIIEGDVRIGTATDVNGSKLTINDNNPIIQLVDNGSATSRGFIWQSDEDLKIGTNTENTTGSFIVRTKGGDRLTVNSDGRVGIGTIYPAAPLDINSSGNVTASNQARTYFKQSGSSSLSNDPNSSGDIAVKADGWFWASNGGFVATSDSRIKNIIGLTDNIKDLETINNIQITNYTYKDKYNDFQGLQKKVIAQQINEIYPIAVRSNKGIIPSVYQVAESIKFEKTTTIVTTKLAHDFKTGDKVKLILDKSGEMITTVTVSDQHTFTIDKKIEENIFVYGKEVDDLLSVDYEAISMLNVSATQALYKKITALEAENKELKSKNTDQQSTNVSLEQRLDKLESIIKTIDISSASLDETKK